MVRALKAMENSAPRVAMGRGGSAPDCTISAGIEEMVEKVAASDSSTPPSSMPSKDLPDLHRVPHLPHRRPRQGRGLVERGHQLLVGPVGKPLRPLDAHPYHVGGLGHRVVDGVGDLDALPLKRPLPLHSLHPPYALHPGDQVDEDHHRVHPGNPYEQYLLVIGREVQPGLHREAEGRVDARRHRDPGEGEPDRSEDHREHGEGTGSTPRRRGTRTPGAPQRRC